RRRAQEARGAEGLRPLRGLWRRRLPRGDGGDAGVVWDAPTGVTASFWGATVDEGRFVPSAKRLGTARACLRPWMSRPFLKAPQLRSLPARGPPLPPAGD